MKDNKQKNPARHIKLLVIEDNRTVQFAVRELLKDTLLWKYEIVFREKLLEAMQLLDKEDFDIVLADLKLPDSPGDRTLSVLKNKITHIPYIILTAVDEDRMVIQSIEAGAQDYIAKEHIMGNGSLLSRSIFHALKVWELKIRQKAIEEENRKYILQIERDLKIKNDLLRKARHLQYSLIQKTIPLFETLNLRALFVPCEMLGGDFIRILKGIHENKMAVIIGDCTDHGVKSSMAASLLLSVIENNISNLFLDNRTDLFLNAISEDFSPIADDDQFPTVLAMIIDLDSNEIFYSSANSEMPYLIRDNSIRQIPKPDGLHLGYDENPDYELKKLTLSPGDRLFFYSDGLIDRGITREVHDVLREWNKGVSDFESLVELLKKEKGNSPFQDDLTLMLLDCVEGKEISSVFHNLNDWEDFLCEMELLLKSYNFDFEEIENISIAANELFIKGFQRINKGLQTNDISVNVRMDGKEFHMIVNDTDSSPERLQKKNNSTSSYISDNKKQLEMLICKKERPFLLDL